MKLLAALYFVLGFSFALIIFGFSDSPPLLKNFHIKFTIPYSWPELLTAIGTLLAVLVALFGDWIRGKIFPSKVRIVDKWENPQGETQGYTRLLVKNLGWSTAYEVEVHVNKIFDGENERLGYLPVPLIWTHTAGTETKRNLHPKQFGYFLDLCLKENRDNPIVEPKIPLIFGDGIKTYQEIHHGQTTLELVISQRSGNQIIYIIKLEWLQGQDKFVRVLSFTKK